MSYKSISKSEKNYHVALRVLQEDFEVHLRRLAKSNAPHLRRRGEGSSRGDESEENGEGAHG